ncbi:tRNA-U16,U17-dihydrouridine synthase [Poseidonocella pacifica]|uniref:tRNA-dihydrouridine(20/20a) synthase n=2 Tax=Poseidonocella pacifica TaxID=871651 RepID=A0A1I0V0T5_9RHOB|nr:tRNA-U16,U17-dihydrouridine synthase [Poseidonocella pacifica]
MMDWTDRHCRYFHRLLSQRALLYTEMVTAPALVRGQAMHLLDHSPVEHPVALQLGGSDPAELAEAARFGCEAGYDEINLNVGCPSDRVQSGAFGAVLMKDPGLVAECVSAMRSGSSAEVTVKCRIGVDDQEPNVVLPQFLARVSSAGCKRFIIHARKAWLKGLSPKENRDVPPLDYDLVARMRQEFPDLHISINGGITTLEQAEEFLSAGFDGVMVGRAAYHNPADILAQADRRIFGAGEDADPFEVAHLMMTYVEEHIAQGGRLHQVARHMLGLFAGRPGARLWRRHISEAGSRADAGPEVIGEALDMVQSASRAAA